MQLIQEHKQPLESYWISNLVDKITAARISESQLIEADISLKEINTVKEVFKKHLKEIYHSRIEYPAANQSGNRSSF